MLEANFSQGSREVSLFGLTQWDKGQQLSVIFDNMPENFQVHFSVRGSSEAVVVDAENKNGNAVVDIPDEMLISEGDIIAWIYLTGESYGETVGKITMYVRPRARPKGYIEELVPSQQQLVEKMIEDMKSKLDYIAENGVDSEYVPEYVKKQSLKTAKKILQCQNENTVSFFAASDFHFDKEDYYTKKAVEHMSQAMKIIGSACKIDFSVCLGGYIADRSDKSISDALDEFISVNKALKEGSGDIPTIRAVGSDDLLSKAFYRNADYFDCSELFNLIGRWSEGAVHNSADPLGGYFYMDFDKAKLRAICLNTSDFKLSEAVKPETDKAKMSSDQLTWLCSALNLSGKEDYENWATLIVSHYPVNFYSNFYDLSTVIKGYISGESSSFLDSQGNEISYDFTGGKNSTPILALFNGALHNLKVNTLSGTSVPLISVPNACFGDNNYFSDESYSAEETLLFAEDATWDKTVSSETDTAFCVVTLDKAEGKLFIHCYGAGYDREISFDAVSEAPDVPNIGGGDDDDDTTTDSGNDSGGSSDGTYVNLVPTSTDESGDVYNRTGYMDSQRIDQSGEQSSYDGYTVTGFIEAVNGDTVRIRGGNWSTAEGNTILAYDDINCLIWSAQLSGSADAASGLSYSGDIAVFESLKVTSGNLSDMAYVRISCSGDGEALIVTVNEEISGSSGSADVTPPVVEYVNIITYATDDYGEVYNKGTGYMDGYKLSSDGYVNESEPDSSFTHTGFIYAEKGAVIRLKGYNFTSDEGNYLIIYDSDYLQLHTIEISGETNDAANGISFSGGVMTLDSSKVTAADLPDSFFIRISCKTSGANLIATYNAELS
ncbi:MAG: hypothetical protein IJW86_08430 [Clostridia bacterium]|nr:hypothetical protein [Clostridia bacterium]